MSTRGEAAGVAGHRRASETSYTRERSEPTNRGAQAQGGGEFGERETFRVLTKNLRDQLQVSFTTYNGAALVDIRVFSRFDRDGAFSPTKRGVTIRAEQLGPLVEALKATLIEARRRGLGRQDLT